MALCRKAGAGGESVVAKMYTLENETIRISVREQGAELRDITGKKENTHYLWQGDPKYWKYSSPVLFPIVGQVVNSTYRVNGKPYQLPAHGLGRTSDFTVIGQTQDSITFELKYSEESLKIYPYRFSLQITYTIGQDLVTVDWKVINLDDKDIYFSIGAHPAFMCPINPQDRLEDCYLEFNQVEDTEIMKITPEVYLSHDRESYLQHTQKLPLSQDVFKNGVLIFDQLKSDTITIRSNNDYRTLSVRAKQFPYWGIWSKETGAPFVCLEPWYGHFDYADFTGDFSEKPGNRQLAPGKTFQCSYEIIIGQ